MEMPSLFNMNFDEFWTLMNPVYYDSSHLKKTHQDAHGGKHGDPAHPPHRRGC